MAQAAWVAPTSGLNTELWAGEKAGKGCPKGNDAVPRGELQFLLRRLILPSRESSRASSPVSDVDPDSPQEHSHLHFAIFRLTEAKRWWEGTAIDPYDVLR